MAALKNRRFSVSKTKINLFLDIALALAFVQVLEEHFTGLNLHELIGIGFGVGLLVHLILHWRWIVSITRTFFRKLVHESRLNYLLSLILFVDLFVIVITGIGISRTLGLSLGLDQSLSHTFESLHRLASSFSLLIVALHVGMHWRWIVNAARQHLLRLPFRRALKPSPTAVTVTLIQSTQHSTGGLR
ncbi:MAG: cytochrome b/b6 domain-containing protein [Anaerolineae bacterium]|nr:cytochrome b/b6 domain-containing protein [Anaerolineae bacterium]